MTLAVLKRRLKFASFFIVLSIYGLGFYFLGKFSVFENLSRVKGVSTQSQINFDVPQDSPIPFFETQAPNVIASYVKLCSNTTYGFEVSYPKDWFTTYSEDSKKCSFFAPYSFVVPKDTTDFLVPVKLEIIPSVDWEETVKFYENPNDFQNILSSQTIEINGRSVQKIRAATTQGQSVPQGYLKVSYLVFDSKNPIVITYQQLKQDENVKEMEDITTQMAESLKFF